MAGHSFQWTSYKKVPMRILLNCQLLQKLQNEIKVDLSHETNVENYLTLVEWSLFLRLTLVMKICITFESLTLCDFSVFLTKQPGVFQPRLI